jgi:hypothetical protein
MKHYRKLQVLAVAIGLAIGGYLASSCKTTPANGDSFYQVVVTCTQENSNNAQASAAVLSCLTSAVGGDYVGCLTGLVSVGHWTVDEVACIVRRYAVESAQRINAGTQTGTDDAVLKNANEFLKQKRIGFR